MAIMRGLIECMEIGPLVLGVDAGMEIAAHMPLALFVQCAGPKTRAPDNGMCLMPTRYLFVNATEQGPVVTVRGLGAQAAHVWIGAPPAPQRRHVQVPGNDMVHVMGQIKGEGTFHTDNGMNGFI